MGRVAHLRSAELHAYLPGGSVADPAHRDAQLAAHAFGAFSAPTEFEGARFVMADADGGVVAPPMEAAATACSSRANGATTTCTGGVRRALVLELWGGGEPAQ